MTQPQLLPGEAPPAPGRPPSRRYLPRIRRRLRRRMRSRAARPRRERYRASVLLAVYRAILLLVWTLLCTVLYQSSRAVTKKSSLHDLASRRERHWLRGVVRIIDLRLRVHGPTPPPGTFIAPNHLGYVDIAAVGVPTGCHWITTDEVTSVPFVGWLLRTSEQIVVPRTRRTTLVVAKELTARRLAAGQSVCVFLEGTSTGGDRVLPFRAPLLQAALDADAPIVPTALFWQSRREGVSVADDLAYWRDEDELPSHLWRLLGLPGFQVEVTFGKPVLPRGRSRKQVAEELRQSVLAMLRASGWRQGPTAVPPAGVDLEL